MATRPTPGGSDGTWGTELNAHLAVSLATDGKVLDGAVFSTSAAPTVDAGVVNKNYVDNLAISVVKAWVQFDGDDATIQGTGFNVSGVVRNSIGNYTITFTDALANNDYAVAGFCADATSGAGMVCNQSNSSPEATTTIDIETWDTEAAALADYGRVHVMIIGDQV